MKSLTEYYPLLRRQGIICPNEAEFQAYHILTHLFTANTVTEVEEKLIRQQNYPVYLDPRVQRAVAIHQMMHCNTKVVRSNKENAKPSLDGAMNAFTRLFRMITNSSSSSSSLSSSSSPSSPLSLPVDYLTGCILQSHFPIIRASALRAMQKAYIYDLDKPDSMMPIADLARMLGYTQDEQGLLELIAFVRSCEVPMLPEDAGCQQEGSMMMMSYSPSLHETVVLLGYFVDRTTEFRKNKLKKGPFTGNRCMEEYADMTFITQSVLPRLVF